VSPVHRLDPYRTWLLYKGVEALAVTLGWTVAAVYFVREVGMSPLELVLMGTALEVAYFVFEVPTGVVADLYGRRISVVVAQVVMGAGFILTGTSTNVGVILAAAALTGFGWTFKSGAEDAWLADEESPERLARAYQRGAQVDRAFTLLGVGLAVGLALVDLRLPIVAGGALLAVLGVLLAIVMPEKGFRPAPRRELGALRSMTRTAHDGGRLIRARPVLLLILGIAFFSGMWSEAIDRLWEAHFLLDVGMPELAGLDSIVWFGVLNAGAILLALLVAQPLVPYFERAGREGWPESCSCSTPRSWWGRSSSRSQGTSPSRWRLSGRWMWPARSRTRSMAPGLTRTSTTRGCGPPSSRSRISETPRASGAADLRSAQSGPPTRFLPPWREARSYSPPHSGSTAMSFASGGSKRRPSPSPV
jgi:MFS family permease